MRGSRALAAAALIGSMTAAPLNVHAETTEVRLARQTGLTYLPILVMVDQRFIESRAKQMGLGDIKVSEKLFSGGAAQNDAILSGNVDFAVAGVPAVALLWEKTRNRLDVRAASAMLNGPLYLNTIDPNIRSLADYTGDSKIAVPAIKVSLQAIALQMAAEKEWGEGGRNRLDAFTVTLDHPQALAALLTGQTEVKSHFASMPFLYAEIKNEKVRTILNTNDVMGGEHTQVVLYTTGKWKKENPRTYNAVLAGLADAMASIQNQPEKAAESYTRASGDKTPPSELAQMIRRTDLLHYTTTPLRTMQLIGYLHRIGFLKEKPERFEDFYWENVHVKGGS
jgi:NitT/TauT family transport system substrate-binding protein